MTAASFGRRGVARDIPTASGGRSVAVSAATRFEATAPRVRDDGLSDDKLFASMPLFTLALALFLFAVFGFERRFAFDVEKDGSISLDSLLAFGAASYDLVVTGREGWRIFLAPLLHGSLSHVLGNLFALTLVGYLLERHMGRGWYAGIFVFAGLTGVAGSLIGNPHAVPTVGASGAITGLVAALFVVSFCHHCDPVERESMRRMSVRFGLPALGPMLYNASSGVDYAAHLGGALGGGGLAFLVTLIWAGGAFRPPFAVRAGQVALVGLALSAASVYFVLSHYQARAAIAAERMPAKAIPGDVNKTIAAAADLVTRYPKDPRSHFFRALAYAKQEQIGAAETELRRAISLATRPQDARVATVAKAYLALAALERGARGEAAQLAKEACASKETPEVRQMLGKEKLCG